MPQLPDIHSWDEDFLLNLPVGEVSYLEFKESAWLQRSEDKWRNDISEYLSAFANYDGGYLIIGVPDPVKACAIIPDGGIQDIVKGGIVQRLQSILPGLVERPLDRIDVWPIGPKAQKSSIKKDHFVLAIHVPASEGAPHQARDFRYYTRLGSHLHPLGHRAIMDIAGRRKHPTVKLSQVRLFWTTRDEFFLSAVVENTSPVLARFCSLILDIPARVGKDGLLSYGGGITVDGGFHWVRVNLKNAFNSPLYPLSTKVFKEKLDVSVFQPGSEELPTSKNVRFKLFVDEMPFLEGELPFDEVLKRES